MCTCAETMRCAEAHAIRDAYHSNAPFSHERFTSSERYTAHLYAAKLMAYPATAAPTWTCAQACEPTAPCRSVVPAQPSLF